MKNQPIPLLLFICTILMVQCNQGPTNEASSTEIIGALPDSIRDIPGLSVKRGLTLKTDEATPGYILFHPAMGTSTYLMNLDGQIVKVWKEDLMSMLSYLMDDGSVIRHDRVLDDKTFAAGGRQASSEG